MFPCVKPQAAVLRSVGLSNTSRTAQHRERQSAYAAPSLMEREPRGEASDRPDGGSGVPWERNSFVTKATAPLLGFRHTE